MPAGLVLYDHVMVCGPGASGTCLVRKAVEPDSWVLISPSTRTSACSLLSRLWIHSVERAMSQRVYKYGMWCDDNFQALDTFCVDKWSRPDVFLLAIMCVLAS